MTDYLFFLLLGTGAGAIIAAFGLGLVVTYQGSGIVNFGFGAMATWVGYVYADLRRGAYPFPIPGLPARYHFGDDVGIWWAFGLALLTAALMGLLVYQLVFRPLYRAPALAKVVASIGLVIVFTSLIERRFPDNAGLRVDAILPREPVTIMDGVTVPRDGLWLVFIVLLITTAVWVSSRYTRLGLATKAAAGNEKGAILLGYSPQRLAQLSFVLASLIGGLVVILASPMIQLSSNILTFGYLIPALGAALIGAFTKVWPTVLTGLAIGLVQSSFTKMQTDFSWFPQYGAREGLPFLVIIVAMVFLGERLPDRGSVEHFRMPAIPPAKVTPLSIVLPVGSRRGRTARAQSVVARGDHDHDDRHGAGAVVGPAVRLRWATVTGAAVVRRCRRFRAVEAGDAVGHPVPDRADPGVAHRDGLRGDRRHPGAAGARDQPRDHHARRWRGDQRVRLQESEVRRRRVHRWRARSPTRSWGAGTSA